jgi:TonB family protein
MSQTQPRGTLLDLPLIEERYGWSFGIAVALHSLLLALFLIAPFLMPKMSIIQLGTGPGGGRAGDSYTVGVTDEPGGGAGLFKPATTQQPPVLPAEKPAKKEEATKAVPLPDTLPTKNKKKAADESTKAAKAAPAAASNQIPVADAKGTGAPGGGTRGSGSVAGDGVGISIGSGSGGVGDFWYARTVEARVGGNWTKPIGLQQRIEIIYSFMVGGDGRIYDIKLEKSCGNEALDLSAARAIRASNPLTVPPPELRGKLLQFTAVFAYPLDK